jgi:TrpR-related protein YerC/YecD
VSVQKSENELFKAVTKLRNEDECRKFFYDLCTPAEISAMSERWYVARLLDKGGMSYRDIMEKTGISTTTISRVARFMYQEKYQGYKKILERIKKGEKE